MAKSSIVTRKDLSEEDWAKFGLNRQEKGDTDKQPLTGSSEGHHDLYAEDQKTSEYKPWWKANFFILEPVLFGTWDGVFTSVMINLFGVIVFLRTGWVVGYAGINQAVLILFLCAVLGLIPILSAVGICERCQIQSGGVYFLISHILGGQIGGAVGVVYTFGQAVATAMVAVGFGASITGLFHSENLWAIRAIAIAVTILLFLINVAGVKWVIKLQLVLLVVLMLAVFDFTMGSFVHHKNGTGVTGFSRETWENNTASVFNKENKENFFTVFGVYFSAFTGILSGVNMSGDLKDPSKSIPLGELAGLAVSTILMLFFILKLGATCERSALMKDVMIANKGYYSLILMACVDANYKFLMVDIGGFGKQGDAWTFSSSPFGKLLLEDKLQVPGAQRLPGSMIECPHVFVADEAFPLQTNLLRPFHRVQLDDDRRIYNYRLSRARRIVENAFGILSARWRILNIPIEAMPENVDRIVKGTVVLHNYLKSTDASSPPNCRYIPPAFVDYEDESSAVQPGEWRRYLPSQQSSSGHGRPSGNSNNYTKVANEVRERFAKYFQTANGSIPWQRTAALS